MMMWSVPQILGWHVSFIRGCWITTVFFFLLLFDMLLLFCFCPQDPQRIFKMHLRAQRKSLVASLWHSIQGSPIQAGKCAVSRSVCSGLFSYSGW